MLPTKILLFFFFLFSQKIYGNDNSGYIEKSELESFLNMKFPYCSTPYTKISEDQVRACKELTENPEWGANNKDKIKEYYDIHEESFIDRNLGFIATNILGAIIHGDLDQLKLALFLNSFDIRKLLKSGPYENAVLSFEAQQLIVNSLKDLPYVIDTHLHNFGYDEGNYLNPSSGALLHAPCMDYFKFMVLRYASGMTQVIGSTHEARMRMHLYAGHFPKLKGFVLPIQQVFRENGKADWEATGGYLNNESSSMTANTFNNRYKDSALIAATSIHPFDPKWKEKMEQAFAEGIRLIKWMPPQGIWPDDPKVFDFYKEMARLKMVLIAHSGPEHGISTNEANKEWEDCGNPLRFRKALAHGVDVILAHAGHHELIPDLDDPSNKKVLGTELFLRIAREAYKKNSTGEWKGRVYGDLAAVTTHYGPEFIKALLNVANEPGIRLVYGSDYPYTNLIQPKKDAYQLSFEAGLINEALLEPLKEIRAWNPLLANFVFTKNLKLKKETGETVQFPSETFTGNFKDAPLLK